MILFHIFCLGRLDWQFSKISLDFLVWVILLFSPRKCLNLLRIVKLLSLNCLNSIFHFLTVSFQFATQHALLANFLFIQSHLIQIIAELSFVEPPSFVGTERIEGTMQNNMSVRAWYAKLRAVSSAGVQQKRDCSWSEGWPEGQRRLDSSARGIMVQISIRVIWHSTRV